jgi:hypothetical protein
LDTGNLFGYRELSVLKESLRKAESFAESFYCIRPREWNKSPYDVLTQGDYPGPLPPTPKSILAEVCRSIHVAARSGAVPEPRHFYSILLRDDNILRTAEAGGGRYDLKSLLVYVLTHEIVHVVRFTRQCLPFVMDEVDRKLEEKMVLSITRKILGKTGDRELLFLADNFEELSTFQSPRWRNLRPASPDS